ncbi:MAG: hypothetical protein O3A95_11035 [Planctomycetota bacterium]|nr:hypothetical protein [Planctomycetota bacterium]
MTKASTEKLGLSFPIQEHWELNEHGLAHCIDETNMTAMARAVPGSFGG